VTVPGRRWWRDRFCVGKIHQYHPHLRHWQWGWPLAHSSLAHCHSQPTHHIIVRRTAEPLAEPLMGPSVHRNFDKNRLCLEVSMDKKTPKTARVQTYWCSGGLINQQWTMKCYDDAMCPGEVQKLFSSTRILRILHRENKTMVRQWTFGNATCPIIISCGVSFLWIGEDPNVLRGHVT